MMAARTLTTAPNRHSTETDRRHLLSPSAAPSAAPSILDFTTDSDHDESTYTDTGLRTPRASSPSIPAATATKPSAEDDQPYRGFSSRAAYLAALHEWAESKKYIQSADDEEAARRQLKGFYGETTMAEYAARPGLELGLKKKWKARKERKASIGR